jgi:hypothetical protein
VDADLSIQDERAGAHERRKLSSGPPSREIHLKETILCVQEAKRARDIFTRCAADRRDAKAIAREFDWRRETRELMTAIKLRQACAQLDARPHGGADSGDKDDEEHDEERFEEPAHFPGML